MAEISNEKELNSTAELVKRLFTSCSLLWVPVSDEALEGEFRNTNSGNMETYLPWAFGQPNGKGVQNHVAFDLDNMNYDDRAATPLKVCVACMMTITTLFRLRGLCKNSYMGK